MTTAMLRKGRWAVTVIRGGFILPQLHFIGLTVLPNCLVLSMHLVRAIFGGVLVALCSVMVISPTLVCHKVTYDRNIPLPGQSATTERQIVRNWCFLVMDTYSFSA